MPVGLFFMSVSRAAPRSRVLDPTTISAREARGFVRDLLLQARHPDWIDAAELAVSEAVTNVVLHAHTQFEITVQMYDDHARIEVRDNNPVLPAQRGYGTEATTGRGMGLIAALSSEHGVTALGAEGKVVWFCIGDPVPRDEEDVLAGWSDDLDLEEAEPAPPGSGNVVLRNLPPTLWLAAREHHDAILRELTLFRAEHTAENAGGADFAVADEARWLVERQVEAEINAARAAGRAARPLPDAHPGALPEVPLAVDLVLSVGPDQVAAFAQLQDALDEAERLAAEGRLLVRPGLPEIVAVRDWACEQVIAQVSGSPSSPWAGADDDRFTGVADDVAELDDRTWDSSVLADPTRSVVAADDANRIIGISSGLAARLGWAPEELVGRRIVAIVPARFREAHVSGFSRHLSTGIAHAIGVPLDLPVLHADGSELVCQFLIQHLRTPEGRSVYIADIRPPQA
ncbi:MAG: ATP-binding protein [Actinobacteria bacterium]|nr:ATP-binding protein [Actinomycetota bacterium]MCA1722614.1 ATP-binding protein [Actinomycetota bacterium]